jgi:hypothetical protein
VIAVGADEKPAEVVAVHTRLQGLALAVEEARDYWSAVDPALPLAERAARAFEERWFGARSLRRVRLLVSSMAFRYDAFPEALAVLRRWPRMSAATRAAICHWHLQLTDPLYRRFSDELLAARRALAAPDFDRPRVARWVAESCPGRWSSPTVVQFASKLLSAASEAGLCTPRRDPRRPLYPTVPDDALAYLLHLLRGVTFAGTLAANPYLTSVGIDRPQLAQRLRTIPSMTYRRSGDLDSFDWEHPSLTAWAEATI